MRFYATEQLGPSQSLTPEGFLLCQAVPLARTGEMIYGPNETPVQPGRDGVVRIRRDAAEVFRPESMASLNGKPVTNDHPPEDVNPANWRNHVVGHVTNPRRGDGDCSDCLVGDLVIFDGDAIEAVRAGKREVSCGYDPDYLGVNDANGELIPGVGIQRNIIYNHVALVDKGRCGGRCSIGDRQTVKESGMARASTRRSVWDRLSPLVSDESKPEFEAIKKEAEKEDKEDKSKDEAPMNGGGEHHVHVHLPESGEAGLKKDAEDPTTAGEGVGAAGASVESRLDRMEAALAALAQQVSAIGNAEAAEATEAGVDPVGDEKILGQLEFEAPPGTGDKARKARDSVYLADSFQDTVSKAEILAPGIRAPTFDKMLAPRKTFDAICKFRRQALDLAYGQPATRAIVDEVLGGRVLDTKTMTCDAVRAAFMAAASIRARDNNGASAAVAKLPAAGAPVAGRVRTLADLNNFNAKRFGRSA